ncbi:hypothetical protein [Muriicola sp.]|uniref:hypothetical protein n=1 Tax=Muriicola sp. TaxID=2020856 RepID=UPI00356B5CB8
MHIQRVKTPDLTKSLEIIEEIVTKEISHPNYARTVALAEFYTAVVDGDNQDKLVTSYKRLETDEQKEQRIHIYNPETPSALNKTISWYTKAETSDKIVKRARFEGKDEKRQQILDDRLMHFYGGKTAEQYLFERNLHYQFHDPNAWLLVEFDAERNDKGNPKEPYRSYPVEIPSRAAFNFEVNNNLPVWLITRYGITFKDQHGKDQPGDMWIYYTANLTITLTEVDPKNPPAEFDGEMVTWKVKNKERTYILEVFETKSQVVPVKRFGFITDSATNHRTYVSPIHTARFLCLELINRKSELDLSWAVHGFPEKREYVPECNFVDDDKGRCRSGRLAHTNEICPACNGTGKQRHFTVQEILTYEMPKTKEEMIHLADMVDYSRPPIDIMKFQLESVDAAPAKIFEATFGLLFSEKPGQPLTATEIDAKYGQISAKLKQYNAHHSNLWKFIATLTAIHAEVMSEDLEIYHQMPNDLGLETDAELMILLGDARKNNAPYDVIRRIEQKLVARQNADSPEALRLYEAKERFRPFRSKTDIEIMSIVGVMERTNRIKILYEYFDEVFRDIEMLHPDFADMAYLKQKEIVDGLIDDIIGKVRADDARTVNPAEELFQ